MGQTPKPQVARNTHPSYIEADICPVYYFRTIFLGTNEHGDYSRDSCLELAGVFVALRPPGRHRQPPRLGIQHETTGSMGNCYFIGRLVRVERDTSASTRQIKQRKAGWPKRFPVDRADSLLRY